MFKLMTTLIRGRATDAADQFTDANALTILRQQLRDAADGVTRAKHSVAVVMAYASRERSTAERIAAQLADLESRAVEALKKDRDDLAMEAASAIANLEEEQAATEKAMLHYDTETRRLREQLSLAEHRLRSLQRGKQIADAAQRTQKLRGTMPDGVINSLRDAEETLARLQARQAHAESIETAMTELNSTSSAQATSDKLAAAGCGAPLRSEAANVIERLRARVA
ncbi:PspA/IM30 family protein [Mesobacterium sp. TK19101]|uniref:PspA/IM30 family protein n=1 Tax=Mesobacterium hydrothermale TaxID=3111907 RepID=A0ABU6HEB9_9RHOB|nr:PspA/IM30 family protein [Mesobacterium sp. TK19101]MEC3860651.1 PspA/IM30 family protein [Mesobacterium sp. TK19101]